MSKKIWTREKCLTEALKYSSKRDFIVGSSMAYHTAIRQGFLDEICNHMVCLRMPNDYWTFERCKERALECKTKKEFRDKHLSAYRIAGTKKWLDVICSHMQKLNNLTRRDVYCIKSLEGNKIYIGLSIEVNQRYKDHLRKPSKKVKDLLCEPHEVLILEKSLEANYAAEREAYYVKYYRDAGFEIFNSIKAGGLGKVRPKWTKQTIQEAAKTCKTRVEFHRRFSGAADAASSLGILEEVLAHLPDKNKQTITFLGSQKTIRQLSDEYGIATKTIWNRHRVGKVDMDLINKYKPKHE